MTELTNLRKVFPSNLTGLLSLASFISVKECLFFIFKNSSRFKDRVQYFSLCNFLSMGYFRYSFTIPNMKDFFLELVILIYGNLTYLNNREISLDGVLNMTSRFLTGRWFLLICLLVNLVYSQNNLY